MASIGEMVISLRADVASFISGIDQANRSLDTVKEHVTAVGSAVQSVQKYFEGFASIAGARELFSFADGLVEAASQIASVTRALGVNAEQFQEQAFAMRQGGVDAEVFSSSMEKLAKNIDLVATGGGSKALVEVFSRLGLSATNFDGTLRSTSDLLDDLAHNHMFQAESEAKKLADYMLLTGARGGEAALGVNALGASFDRSKADALAFNQVLSQDTIDTLTRVKEQFETDATAVKNFFATVLAEGLKANSGPNLYTLTNGLFGVAPGEALDVPKPPTADKPAGPPVQPGGAEQAKQLQSFNTDYDKLLANYRLDLEYQRELKTAYTDGAAAVRQLQVDHAGELAVYKLLDEAELKHVAVSDQMLEAARKAAEADENAKLMASEQKTVTDDLAASIKKQNDALDAIAKSSDLLTEKEQKLADAEGLVWAAFNNGAISADQFNQKMKVLVDTFNGPDKGMEEFTKGLSSDFSELIGKVTDFSAMIEESKKTKGKDSIFAQFKQDADDFTASLEKMLLKLALINPLLNALGLGGENGKQLPTLFGNTSGAVAPTIAGGGTVAQTAQASSSPFGGIASAAISGGKSVLSFLSGLFGGTTSPGGAIDADASTGASLNSDIVDALSGGALGGAGGFDLGDFDLPGFANGGEFVVGGIGGTDSQLIQFKATPGEKVAVGPNAERGDAPAVTQIYSPTFVTPNVDSFKKTHEQHAADAMRQMRRAGRYA